MFIKSVIVLSLVATACSNKEPKQTTYNLSDLFIETHANRNGYISPVLWHADRECTNVANKDLPFMPGDAYLEEMEKEKHYYTVSPYIPKYCNVCMQGSRSKVIGDPTQDKSCATSQDKEHK